LLCLKALWSLEEASVRDVQRVLAATKPLAYTTVMTLMERLVRKGAIARRKAGRAFLYSPQVSRDAIRRRALEEFLEGHFDGSPRSLMEFLRNQGSGETARHPNGSGLDTVLL
jgi:predicted transcriptional regulator